MIMMMIMAVMMMILAGIYLWKIFGSFKSINDNCLLLSKLFRTDFCRKSTYLDFKDSPKQLLIKYSSHDFLRKFISNKKFLKDGFTHSPSSLEIWNVFSNQIYPLKVNQETTAPDVEFRFRFGFPSRPIDSDTGAH